MRNLSDYTFVTIAVADAGQLAAVYALLGSVSTVALATAGPVKAPEPALDPAATPQPEAEVPAGEGAGLDAHGHPWSAELHASTKGTTKDGLWRMKVGVSRPDPAPGYPIVEPTGTKTDGAVSGPAGSATSGTAGSPAGEEDEFAAFRAAAAASDVKDAEAKANVQPRKFSDADLGALCNQAATKLGDPTPVKEIIAQYIPEGQVAHSRNIPEDRREDFAKAVEAKAGIEFAG